MITHIALVGAGRCVAEWVEADGIGSADPSTVVVSIGESLAVHLDPEAAEDLAETLLDALTTRDQVVAAGSGPRAYIPAWRPV